MPDYALTPVQPQANATLQGIAERYTANFPTLHSLARQAAGHIVRDQLGYWMDPDRIYWHRFNAAISSHLTYTGWRHEGRPLRSMTLSELTLRRFLVDEQSNSDLLSLYGGFYRVDGAFGRYDQTCEVRLLPATVQQAFWALDFQPVYLAAVTKFWSDAGEDFCLLARAGFLAAVARARLAREDAEALCAAVVPGAVLPVGLQQLRSKPALARDSPFRHCLLGGYRARDLFWLTLPGGRQVLYLCGQGGSELQVFASTADLNTWVRRQVHDTPSRERFIAHFLGDAAALADHGDALQRLCDQLQSATVSLVRARQAIRGDVFDSVYRSAVDQLVRDARARTTSNSALDKAQWLEYLKLVPRFATPAALLWWPLAGLALGAGVGNLVLHVDQALHAPLQAQRRAGWVAAFIDVLFILIDSQMLRAGEVVESPGLIDAPALLPEQGYVPGSLRTLEGGGQAVPGLDGPFWDLHMRASADELLAVSDLALARQRALLVQVPRADLDAFGQPFRVYCDELGFHARNIRQYTHSPQRYNNLLRGLAMEDAPAANVARVHDLAEELELLGGDNQVRLYRVGIGGRETSGAYWRVGRVKVGDRLLTTDFTSFTENPYMAWEFFNQPTVKAGTAFEEGAVVYVLEPGGARCAVPVAAFSDLQHEAESVVLPGSYLQVEGITEVSGEHYRFMQVRLRALEAGGGDAYELRTGQPFDRERFAQRLGEDGGSVVERFFLRY
ncbi:hypothetical protein D3C77_62640 [compost metagenome]